MDKATIEAHIGDVIEKTDFRDLGERRSGKVRDVYVQPDRLILVATDRYSAFDRNLCLIPFKGNVLTQVSTFWFEKTVDIVKNHVIAIPDSNVMVTERCEVIPIELVPRAYITGVTGTSIWTLYQKGERRFGDLTLPEGMKKNQKLPHAILTPATKSDTHDRPITRDEIINEGLVKKEIWEQIEDLAMRLFARGEELAKQRGLILVDTKYEFGISPKGEVMLIDEIHTPDSSRYWQQASYEARIAKGEEPENFDKEFLRLWFKEHCDPYKDAVLPEAPREMVVELASRYVKIFEQITGRTFAPDFTMPALDRIRKNLEAFVLHKP